VGRPNELFPTEIRATAVGIGTAASRIGAAISFVGLAVTVAWGVETAGRSLSEAANAKSGSPEEPVSR
jgi:MFS transporter, putative metabolite transport protein